jgi:hypothetical protein
MEEFIMYNNDKEFNYTDMLDEDNDYYFEDEVEYLEEANTASGFDSIVSNMFGHMVKFKHQPEKQSSSWVRTINRNNKDIIKLYPRLSTNERNKIAYDVNGYLDRCFNEGLKVVVKKDTGKTLKIPRPSEWDWDFIFNRKRIKNFLLENINDSIWIDDIRSTIENECFRD